MAGLFLGSKRRNDPLKVVGDPHPVPRYPDTVHRGNVPLDGYKLLSRADPNYQGQPPYIGVRPVHAGPDDSFEQ